MHWHHHTAALVLCFFAMTVIPIVATAAPTADGLFDPTEGYTFGRWVDFAVEIKDSPTTTVSGGQLWLYEDADSGNVCVAFIQPLTLVDNTYGTNAIGWGAAAPSGKQHKFGDLKGSDKVEFLFTDGDGNTVLNVEMDYLTETSKHSGVYESLGVSGGDGKVISGSASSVLEWGTSLDYNFNTLNCTGSA